MSFCIWMWIRSISSRWFNWFDYYISNSSLSLEANDINNSNCASYEWGCFCFEWNSVTKISYITCISVYGELTLGIVLSKRNCYNNYINFIQSHNFGCIFLLDDLAQVYIKNIIFYNVFSLAFSYGNKYDNFHI